jgi:hypothetical protein
MNHNDTDVLRLALTYLRHALNGVQRERVQEWLGNPAHPLDLSDQHIEEILESKQFNVIAPVINLYQDDLITLGVNLYDERVRGNELAEELHERMLPSYWQHLRALLREQGIPFTDDAESEYLVVYLSEEGYRATEHISDVESMGDLIDLVHDRISMWEAGDLDLVWRELEEGQQPEGIVRWQIYDTENNLIHTGANHNA